MPSIEKFNREKGGDAIAALRRQREASSARVERARPLEIRIKGVGEDHQRRIAKDRGG